MFSFLFFKPALQKSDLSEKSFELTWLFLLFFCLFPCSPYIDITVDYLSQILLHLHFVKAPIVIHAILSICICYFVHICKVATAHFQTYYLLQFILITVSSWRLTCGFHDNCAFAHFILKNEEICIVHSAWNY